MSQFHSVAVSGMNLFDRPIESILGSVTIDLASAPLQPGEHELRVESVVGSVTVYVPNYVKLSVEGGAIIGGYDVYEGLDLIEGSLQRMRRFFRMSNQVPATAAPAPELPVSIKLVIEGGIGGIDIYRLPPS